jgi:DNA-binding GntR family transcriptional regulator
MKSSDRISASLEESILRGDYKNGQQLNEIDLSHQFKVSRTPIREALQKLTKSGLVEQIHGRGVFVLQPGPNELFELFEFMAELESSCGRLAAMRISESALDELHKTNAKCKVAMLADDTDNYYYANRVFHSVIYRESGNSVLERETIRIHLRLEPYRRIQLQVRGRMPQSMSEHEVILEALKVGDADKVALVLREHVAIQGEKFKHLLSNLE